MKGGSVASDAVVQLVPANAFKLLNSQFTNVVGGGKKKSPKPKAVSSKPTKPKKGGMCPMCGGTSAKLMNHINEFDDSGLTQLRNKKGGAGSPSPSPLFDIKYDYANAIMQSPHGDGIDRSMNLEATRLMTNEAPSVLGGFQKSISYGNVTDIPDTNFIYGGAKKTVSKKQTKAKSPAKKTKSSGKKAVKK